MSLGEDVLVDGGIAQSGSPGNGGTPPSAGSPGIDIVARANNIEIAGTPQLTNRATAIGQSGGLGGDGGEFPGAPGGRGGNAQAVGLTDLVAAGNVIGDTLANATALGGRGGNGGQGGAVAVVNQLPSGRGGQGGSASSNASATSFQGSATANSSATGGSGGNGGNALAGGPVLGGDGRDASSVATANANGYAEANSIASGGFGGKAFGDGSRGGNAGSATSQAVSVGTTGSFALSNAYGGVGGPVAFANQGFSGNGGNAVATAQSTATAANSRADAVSLADAGVTNPTDGPNIPPGIQLGSNASSSANSLARADAVSDARATANSSVNALAIATAEARSISASVRANTQGVNSTVDPRIVGTTTAGYSAIYTGGPQSRSIGVQQSYDGNFSTVTASDNVLFASMNLNPLGSNAQNIVANNANILSNLGIADNALSTATVTFQLEPNARLTFSHSQSLDGSAFAPGSTWGFGLANANFAAVDYLAGSFDFFLRSANGELIQQSFQNGVEANAYFTDRWFDFGTINQSPGAQNDFNWGFTVTAPDLVAIRSFNTSAFSNSFQTVTGAVSAIPEPSSILSLVVASTVAILRYRRRKRTQAQDLV